MLPIGSDLSLESKMACADVGRCSIQNLGTHVVGVRPKSPSVIWSVVSRTKETKAWSIRKCSNRRKRAMDSILCLSLSLRNVNRRENVEPKQVMNSGLSMASSRRSPHHTIHSGTAVKQMAATNHGDSAIPSLSKSFPRKASSSNPRYLRSTVPRYGPFSRTVSDQHRLPRRTSSASWDSSLSHLQPPNGTVPSRAARRTSDRPSGIDMEVSLSLVKRSCRHGVVTSSKSLPPRLPVETESSFPERHVRSRSFDFGEEEGRSLPE